MKKLLVASIAAAALSGASAIAADMPMKAPMAVPYDPWSGCYVGANTGGAWSESKFVRTFAPPTEDESGNTASGWAYGGQIGCDYQFNNSWVVGIQGMFDGASLSGSNPRPLVPVDTWQSKIRSFGTVTGRLGYLINPALLFYGKAGIGWADSRYTFFNPASPLGSTSASSTRSGFDLGVGTSWMFAPHWDLFVEYDHMFLGRKSLNFNDGLGQFTMDIRQNFDKVLVGVDYRFSGR